MNELANCKPIEWFEQNLIARVPFRHAGAFRKRLSGFVQLAAFMSMNIDRHVRAHRELYDNLRIGELEKAKLTKDFYDEYFAVLDLTAEFYLETVRIVFQEHRLPKGTLEWRGERVEPRAIRAGRRCSRSRARRMTSARSARRSLRMICARACGRIASGTTCRRASATTACSPASAGRTRFIRW